MSAHIFEMPGPFIVLLLGVCRLSRIVAGIKCESTQAKRTSFESSEVGIGVAQRGVAQNACLRREVEEGKAVYKKRVGRWGPGCCGIEMQWQKNSGGSRHIYLPPLSVTNTVGHREDWSDGVKGRCGQGSPGFSKPALAPLTSDESRASVPAHAQHEPGDCRSCSRER